MFDESNNDFENSWENFGSEEPQKPNAQRRKNLMELLIVVLTIAIAAVVILFTKFGHEHVWLEASCTVAKVCTECGETEGEALGHNWKEATCTSPMVCVRCRETEGEPLGHDWLSATDLRPSSCAACGTVTGRSLGYDLTWCTVLGDSNGQSSKDICAGDWWDTYGNLYEDALRFWVADFGNWNEEEYIQYDLGGQFAQLELTIAPEENSESNTRGKILIYCGTELLYESDWVTDTTQPVYASVDVRGCQEIKIVCRTDSNDFHYCIVDAMLYN